MEIRPLTDTDFDTLAEAFARAFADYDTQWDPTELRRMLRRRGFAPHLSFAAFDDGRIAAFTLNGIGDFDGLRTAYDTGTATLPDYRAQGLATRIFEHSLPHLRAAGVRQYLLEVLQHNAKAISVYRKLGFETTREFDYFRQECPKLHLPVAPPLDLRDIDPAAAAACEAFRDFRPSWQNDTASVARGIEELVAFAAFIENRPVGYCIAEPASGDIAQIAVDPPFRRRGIGTRLLARAAEASRTGAVKIVNTESRCPSIAGFLAARNIPRAGGQFEMIKKL